MAYRNDSRSGIPKAVIKFICPPAETLPLRPGFTVFIFNGDPAFGHKIPSTNRADGQILSLLGYKTTQKETFK